MSVQCSAGSGSVVVWRSRSWIRPAHSPTASYSMRQRNSLQLFGRPWDLSWNDATATLTFGAERRWQSLGARPQPRAARETVAVGAHPTAASKGDILALRSHRKLRHGQPNPALTCF